MNAQIQALAAQIQSGSAKGVRCAFDQVSKIWIVADDEVISDGRHSLEEAVQDYLIFKFFLKL